MHVDSPEIEIRLVDGLNPDDNPNLDYVLSDAANIVARPGLWALGGAGSAGNIGGVDLVHDFGQVSGGQFQFSVGHRRSAVTAVTAVVTGATGAAATAARARLTGLTPESSASPVPPPLAFPWRHRN